MPNFVFTDRMWPDFDAADLDAALGEFNRRERRFGGVPEAALSTVLSAGGA
jgi:undecaprenyl diphosphate synthase